MPFTSSHVPYKIPNTSFTNKYICSLRPQQWGLHIKNTLKLSTVGHSASKPSLYTAHPSNLQKTKKPQPPPQKKTPQKTNKKTPYLKKKNLISPYPKGYTVHFKIWVCFACPTSLLKKKKICGIICICPVFLASGSSFSVTPYFYVPLAFNKVQFSPLDWGRCLQLWDQSKKTPFDCLHFCIRTEAKEKKLKQE